MKKIYLLLIITAPILLVSCKPPAVFEGAFPISAARKLVFFTGLDETLGIIDPDNLEIYNNIANTETGPNHLYIKGNELFVTNSLSNSIQVFTYRENDIYETDRIYLGKNTNPWMIISDGSSRAYVPCFISDDIAVIDLETRTVIDADLSTPDIIDRIPAQEGPEGGCIISSKLYVVNTAWSQNIFGFKKGSLTIADTVENQVLTTLWLDNDDYIKGKGSNPQSVIPFPELNEVHVICTGVQGENDGKIIIVDTQTDTVKEKIEIGGSPGWAGDSINKAETTVFLTGVEGIQAYNYETKEIHGKECPGRGWYIHSGEDSDFYSGIYYDKEQDYIFVCRFNDNKVTVLKKKSDGEYQKITEMETYNGPQGNIIQLP